jgi:hypothetical protein
MRSPLALLAVVLLACSGLPALATPCGQQVDALQAASTAWAPCGWPVWNLGTP